MNHKIAGRGAILVVLALLAEATALGETKDLGNGFRDHGKATPEGVQAAPILTVATGPNGTICGSKLARPTAFIYKPKTDEWEHQEISASGFLALDKKGAFFYVTSSESLKKWDPLKPEYLSKGLSEKTNPYPLARCNPVIREGGDVLALSDGKTVVMVGKPRPVENGGGLFFWDNEFRVPMLVGFRELFPSQWTVSLAELSEGKLVGGNAIERTDEKEQTDPELYIMEVTTKTMEWHKALFADVTEYASLCTAQNGLVYGIARVCHNEIKEGWDPKRFFAFDPILRTVVYQKELEIARDQSEGGAIASYGGPRAFIRSKGAKFYMLFKYCIAEVNLSTHALSLIAHSPVEISAGGDILDGRIYFGGGEYLYSFEVPTDTANSPANTDAAGGQ